MKKAVFVFFLILIMLFPRPAFAHKGRTDSNGGHHDYNNVSGLGSYHYHHGYPPHLHTNGVCPYDYDDNTNHSSETSSISSSVSSAVSPSSKPSSSYGTPYKTHSGYVPGVVYKPGSTTDKSSDPPAEETDYSGFYLFGGFVAFILIVNIWDVKKEKRKERERERRIREKREREAFEYARLFYFNKYAGKTTASIVGVPEDHYLDENFLPCSPGKYWGAYTVYISQYGDKYHCANCRFVENGTARIPKNIVYVQRHGYERCTVCNPYTPNPSWAENYRLVEAIKKKYGID